MSIIKTITPRTTSGVIYVSNQNPPTAPDSPVKQSVPRIKNIKHKVVPLREDEVEGLYWRHLNEVQAIYDEVQKIGGIVTGYVNVVLVNDDASAITFANYPEFSCTRTHVLPELVANRLREAINDKREAADFTD